LPQKQSGKFFAAALDSPNRPEAAHIFVALAQADYLLFGPIPSIAPVTELARHKAAA
jgi:hypothetical protein